MKCSAFGPSAGLFDNSRDGCYRPSMEHHPLSLVPGGIGPASGCFAAGLAMGAAAWALCPLMGGLTEPFDNGPGFLAGQVLMVVGIFWIGWATGSWAKVAFAVLGLYVGQVAYSAIAVGTEWVPLGAVTILALCVFPAVGGLLSLGLGRSSRRRTGHNL